MSHDDHNHAPNPNAHPHNAPEPEPFGALNDGGHGGHGAERAPGCNDEKTCHGAAYSADCGIAKGSRVAGVAQIVGLTAGLWLIGLGVWMGLRPRQALGVLAAMGSSPVIHSRSGCDCAATTRRPSPPTSRAAR